jgi:hypothetical protein
MKRFTSILILGLLMASPWQLSAQPNQDFDLDALLDCDCELVLEPVCVNVGLDMLIPFPNACIAECLGFDVLEDANCELDEATITLLMGLLFGGSGGFPGDSVITDWPGGGWDGGNWNDSTWTGGGNGDWGNGGDWNDSTWTGGGNGDWGNGGDWNDSTWTGGGNGDWGNGGDWNDSTWTGGGNGDWGNGGDWNNGGNWNDSTWTGGGNGDWGNGGYWNDSTWTGGGNGDWGNGGDWNDSTWTGGGNGGWGNGGDWNDSTWTGGGNGGWGNGGDWGNGDDDGDDDDDGDGMVTGNGLMSNFTSADMDGIIVNLFPNPATEQLNIRADQALISLELYDFNGRKVLEKQLDGSQYQTLQLSHLATGSYLLRVLSDEGVAVKQLQIQH